MLRGNLLGWIRFPFPMKSNAVEKGNIKRFSYFERLGVVNPLPVIIIIVGLSRRNLEETTRNIEFTFDTMLNKGIIQISEVINIY